MALYEKLPPRRERTHKYSTQISDDPLTGLQRFVDVQELNIGGFSIRLNCDIDYVDSEGNQVNTERVKSYSHILYASKESPWVDAQGNRVEEGTEGAITRYAFLMAMFEQPILHPQGLLGYELMFIQNADITLKEFDK